MVLQTAPPACPEPAPFPLLSLSGRGQCRLQGSRGESGCGGARRRLGPSSGLLSPCPAPGKLDHLPAEHGSGQRPGGTAGLGVRGGGAPATPSPTHRTEGQPPGQGLQRAGWMPWEAAPDIKSLAGTMDGEAVPGGMRGSSFMEAATIPSPQERVIKQVNKAVALLKSARVPGAGG